MVSIESFPVRQKAWQSRDILSQFGARLCGTIACIGSEWHGTGVPTWSSSYSDLPFSSWQTLESKKLFMLHTGSFIDAYGRLMKVVRCTKVVSEGAPSLHRISLATPSLTVKWWTNHKVFSIEFIFGDVPFTSGLFFWFSPTDDKEWMFCQSETFTPQLGCSVSLPKTQHCLSYQVIQVYGRWDFTLRTILSSAHHWTQHWRDVQVNLKV